MSGVWVFKKNGVIQLIESPTRALIENPSAAPPNRSMLPGRRTELVYVPTGHVIQSHAELERCLRNLGWTRYRMGGDPELIQFHRRPPSLDLISLPRQFSDVRSPHMYDIAIKNRNFFVVRDPSMNQVHLE